MDCEDVRTSQATLQYKARSLVSMENPDIGRAFLLHTLVNILTHATVTALLIVSTSRTVRSNVQSTKLGDFIELNNDEGVLDIGNGVIAEFVDGDSDAFDNDTVHTPYIDSDGPVEMSENSFGITDYH